MKFFFQIRKQILHTTHRFDNLKIAQCHEDLAYCLYHENYENGNFYEAIEHCADSYSMRREFVKKDDHMLVGRTLRILALIFEEIFVDTKYDSYEFDQYVSCVNKNFDYTWHCKNKKLLDRTTTLNWCAKTHLKYLNLSLKVFGQEHYWTGKCYSNLGRVHQTMRLPMRAIHFHEEAIKIYKKLFGNNDHKTACSYGLLACVITYNMNLPLHRQHYKKAEGLYLKAIEVFKARFGEKCPTLEYYYRGLMHLYYKENWHGYLHYSNVYSQWKLMQVDHAVPNANDNHIENAELNEEAEISDEEREAKNAKPPEAVEDIDIDNLIAKLNDVVLNFDFNALYSYTS